MDCQQYWDTNASMALLAASSDIKEVHLRDLLKDESRNKQLIIEAEGLLLFFLSSLSNAIQSAYVSFGFQCFSVR